MNSTNRLAVLERTVNLDRVAKLHHLLQGAATASLHDYVAPQMETGLLSDEVLDIARAQQRFSVVLFLATLGCENLPTPNDRHQWLTVYGVLSQAEPPDALDQLNDKLPIWWLTKAMAAPASLSAEALKQGLDTCECDLCDLDAAFELTFDFARFDLGIALIESLHAAELDTQAWLHVANTLVTRFTQYGGELAPSARLPDLARSFARIADALPNVQALSPIKSMLALKAAQVYLRCRHYAEALHECDRCTDAQDQQEAGAIRAQVEKKMRALSTA